MALRVPSTLSPSKVSTFKDCALAFRFSAIDRLPEAPSAPATKGTLVHRALELLMLREPAGRTIDAALVDLETARAELAEHPEFAGLDLNEAEWAAFHADAELLVRRYFELEDPQSVRPIGLELKLSAEVGRVTLRGYIDRLELDANGEFVITDYKTGSVPSEMYENSRLAGVHIYAFLCERMLGRRPAKVQLYFLSKPEAIIATPSAQSVTAVERKTTAAWNAIVRACDRDDFRPRPGRLCDWCTFKPYCPAWGGDPAQAAELRGPGTMIETELPMPAPVAGR
jgi:putative RecB family exonuclease